MSGAAQLVQAVIDGVTIGASYAIIALAFSVIWATTRTVNLALIQIVAVGGLFAYLGAKAGGFALALLLGLAAAGLIGTVSHYVAIVPTLRKGQIYPIIASLGFGILVQSVLSLTFGNNDTSLPSIL